MRLRHGSHDADSGSRQIRRAMVARLVARATLAGLVAAGALGLTEAAYPATTPGLVAAYSFDEGAGTTVADASGNGNVGTITNATWSTAGKFGSALSFNGSTSWVTVSDSPSLDLSSAVTIEAWVRPHALGKIYRTVVVKQQSAQLIYALYANNHSDVPTGNVYTAADGETQGPASLPLYTWTHLAQTWDGMTLRLYVNGSEVSSRAVTGTMPSSTAPLRIGGNSVWGEAFSGQLDEIRIYNRALLPAEIQSDMTTPIGPVASDTTPPLAPTALVQTGATSSSATVSWAASSDTVGVAGYDLYVDGVPDGTTNLTSATVTGLPCGSTHTIGVDAYDVAGNRSPPATLVVATSACPDTTPPTQPANLTQTAATATSVAVSWSPSTDNVGVTGYDLFAGGLSAGTTTATSWTLQGLACGTTTLLGVAAHDAAGNRSGTAAVSATTSPCAPPPPTVAVISPSSGSTVSGTVAITASASAGVVGVQFRIDGVNLGTEDTAVPYTASWQSATVGNGAHTITASARDAAGNTTAATVTVTVANPSSAITVRKVFEASDTDRQVHYFAVTSAVPAGDTLLLTHGSTIDATDGTGGIVTPDGVKDTRGNVWVQDAVSHPGTTFTTIEVWSAYVSTPLSAGDLIEVDGYGRGLSDEIAVFDVSGLAGPQQSARLDQSASSSGYAQTQSTPAVTTTQAHELLVGLHGQSHAAAPWWTADTVSPPWTTYVDRFDGGNISEGIAVVMREVTAVGTYQSSGSDSSAQTQNNLIVTYRASS
jgi:chitodextrinase